MIVRLDPAARDDIRDATEWYARRNTNVACRFITAVEAAIIEISKSPEGPPRSETWTGIENIRRIRLRRFPYIVVFEMLPAEIVIWCISHTSRKPNHWRDRRLERPE